MPETESVARSLERYVSILRRQWWVMVIVVIVALAAAAFYVSNATPVYSASSKVVVGQDQTLFNPAVSVNYQAFTSTISSLLQSNVVAQDTIKKLGLKMTPTQLLSNLSVSAQPSGAVIDVAYNDPDKARAVRILSTVGQVFTFLVNNKLATKPTGGSTQQPVSAAVFDPAHGDPGQVSPHKTRALAIALVLGLVAGFVLAFLRDALSSAIKSEDDAEAAYGAPIIGTLPRRALGVGAFEIDALPRKQRIRVGEAFRMLAARLRYSTTLERGVIVVVGARPEDGKSTVAAHLAAELAGAGKDVVAVEADLHRPALHRLLGVDPRLPGILEVSASGAALTTRLVEIDPEPEEAAPVRPARLPAIAAGRRARSEKPEIVVDDDDDDDDAPPAAAAAQRGRLRLLPAGLAGSAKASNVLSVSRASSLIVRLRALSDYVVIDTPPLLLSADAYPLVQLADVVVIACRMGSTRHHEAARARATLRSLGAENCVLVLTEADSSSDGEYYGYEAD
jgi:capsular polysaccharide biosynthesis protein/Mrp family chromosome partitioning ATPase